MRIRLLPPLAACVLSLLATQAAAGSFTVNPVRLELAAGQHATSMLVSNAGNAATMVQVSVHRWTRVDGVDVLEPVTGDDAPIVTPPMFRLDVADQQIVRIGFAGRQLDSAEGHWRVIVEELPQPQVATPLVQIAMRLRMNLPLFRQPAERRSALAWSTEQSSDGLALDVDNRGTITERIDAATVAGNDGKALSTLTGPLYVFPGEHRAFPLKLAAPLPATANAVLSVQGSLPLHDHELAWQRQ
ncbi:molecular chaperone [uncultured Nevskia sp.]|uniref:fimbrial biogenesis chaperone n=1 Tax=uncultured Nevskia sp. TaxID=228950 RepID=UPI0025FB17FA|nr:fimbria/pilus periplasmic chaperone [uncultured Nevskia sp.]